MLNKVFNGFVVYVISNLCVISLFDLSPLLFSVTSIVPFSLMVFGLYNTYGLSGTADSCLLYVVLFVLAFYKRYLQKAKMEPTQIRRNLFLFFSGKMQQVLFTETV